MTIAFWTFMLMTCKLMLKDTAEGENPQMGKRSNIPFQVWWCTGRRWRLCSAECVLDWRSSSSWIERTWINHGPWPSLRSLWASSVDQKTKRTILARMNWAEVRSNLKHSRYIDTRSRRYTHTSLLSIAEKHFSGKPNMPTLILSG